MSKRSPLRALLSLLVLVALVAAACSSDSDSSDGAAGTGTAPEDGGTLTLYTGRGEDLMQPVIEAFEEATGITVDVRYGGTAELALLIQAEGDRSPADVFLSQSPGAVGFLAGEGMLAQIDEDVANLVEERFRNDDRRWVGITGRIRTLVYNTELVDPADLPASVFDLADPEFASRLGEAPTNGSFQDWVTALSALAGEDATLEFLTALADAGAPTYPKNGPIVEAVGRGEIPFGLVNHYYAHILKAENPDLPVENYIFPDADLGALLLTTSASIVAPTNNADLANRFIEFLLGDEAQRIFAADEFEYPLAKGQVPVIDLPPLGEIDLPAYDLEELGGGLARTQELIDESGVAGV